MRLSFVASCVAACALIASAPAFARDGGGHRGGGGHGGGHYSGGGHGGGHYGGGYRGGFRGGYGGFRGGYGGYGSRSCYGPSFGTVIVREAVREVPAFPDGFAGGQGEAPKQSWYFCQDSGQYYPYVRSCASAWQEVPAIPPPPAPNEAK